MPKIMFIKGVCQQRNFICPLRYFLIQKVGSETDNKRLGSDAISEQTASELLKEHTLLFQPKQSHISPLHPS